MRREKYRHIVRVRLTKRDISADNGKTWTTEYLTDDEAQKEKEAGNIVRLSDPPDYEFVCFK